MRQIGKLEQGTDDIVTYYVTAEEEDYEIHDTANYGETTGDIERQEAITTEQERLLKQLIEENVFTNEKMVWHLI